MFWSTFKVLGMRDFMIFAERFGIPYVTGEYADTITDEDKEILRAAVRDLGSDGFAIFSDAAKIVMHELKANNSNSAEGIHRTLISICDKQISRLVEGATLVSSVDGPGSHALGRVHQNRYFDILLGDAERLSRSFETSVGLPFVRFNGLDAKPPRLKMHLGLNMSPEDQIDMVIKMANNLEGFEADEDQLRRITLAKKPQDGQGLRGLEFAKIDARAQTEESREDA
jgi:phage gp29-like protein